VPPGLKQRKKKSFAADHDAVHDSSAKEPLYDPRSLAPGYSHQYGVRQFTDLAVLCAQQRRHDRDHGA
jgi:hypothetical protein